MYSLIIIILINLKTTTYSYIDKKVFLFLSILLSFVVKNIFYNKNLN